MAVPRRDFPGRREADRPGRSQRQGQARLLSRDHRPLHGVPHADGERASRFRAIARQPAAASSPGRGAIRSRATSRRARPRASATGPTPRSSARSPRASTRTARSSMPPMGFGYYAHMTDADLDAVIAWVRTVPREGVKFLSSPRSGGGDRPLGRWRSQRDEALVYVAPLRATSPGGEDCSPCRVQLRICDIRPALRGALPCQIPLPRRLRNPGGRGSSARSPASCSASSSMIGSTLCLFWNEGHAVQTSALA